MKGVIKLSFYALEFIYNNQSSLLGRYSVKENEPIDIHLLWDGFYIVQIIKDSKIYEAKLIIKRD